MGEYSFYGIIVKHKRNRNLPKIVYKIWDKKDFGFVFKKDDKNGGGIENLRVRGRGSAS